MRRLFHQIYFSLFGATLIAVVLTAIITHHLFGEDVVNPYAERLRSEATKSVRPSRFVPKLSPATAT